MKRGHNLLQFLTALSLNTTLPTHILSLSLRLSCCEFVDVWRGVKLLLILSSSHWDVIMLRQIAEICLSLADVHHLHHQSTSQCPPQYLKLFITRCVNIARRMSTLLHSWNIYSQILKESGHYSLEHGHTPEKPVCLQPVRLSEDMCMHSPWPAGW